MRKFLAIAFGFFTSIAVATAAPYNNNPYTNEINPGVDLGNIVLPAALGNLFGNSTGAVYYSNNYGGIWDGASGHDVGPALDAALAACHTGGGGIVRVPAGTYYYATQYRDAASGCRLSAPTDEAGQTNTDQSTTTLRWNGSAGATMALWGPNDDPV